MVTAINSAASYLHHMDAPASEVPAKWYTTTQDFCPNAHVASVVHPPAEHLIQRERIRALGDPSTKLIVDDTYDPTG